MQRAAPDPGRRLAGAEHGDIETLLDVDEVRAAEPLEQRPVGLAAAQEHVLAVVHPQAVALEGVGRAAEPAPDLDERHARARRGAVERRRDARQPAADHGDPSHAPAPSRPRAATQAFSRAGSDIRPDERRRGLGGDPLEQTPVDARHRQHAGGAAPVEHLRQRHAPREPLACAGRPRRRRAARARAARPPGPPRAGAVEPLGSAASSAAGSSGRPKRRRSSAGR